MSRVKNPPSFDPEVDEYMSWKTDDEIWKLFTDTAEAKIGAAVYLAVQGKAREVLWHLNTADIGADRGYDLVIEELDKVYLANEHARAFVAFNEYYE